MAEDDCQLSAALLEVRSIPQQRLHNTPLLFALGTTLELATLPDEARPSKPGQSAIASHSVAAKLILFPAPPMHENLSPPSLKKPLMTV